MARLMSAAALSGLLLTSGMLGGCATSWQHREPSAASYEATGGYQWQYRQIAEDLAQSLALVYAPAKTTLEIAPPAFTFRANVISGFLSRNQDNPTFGWELERVLRQKGFAIQSGEAESETLQAPLPLTYVIDALGRSGYRAGICISQEWCADRLYLTDQDGRLTPAGGAIRTLVVRT